MPLLEINQVSHICASVRGDEETAAQVDQYAAVIRASADDVVDKALNYVFSKDRDFQEFLKTPQAKQVASTLRVRKVGTNGAPEQPGKKVAAGVESTSSVRMASRDRASYFAAVEERCFAPEELWTRHPQFGNCGALASAAMFTGVNLFLMSGLLRDVVPARHWRLRFVNGKTPLSALGVNTFIRNAFMNCRNTAIGG